MFEEIASNGNAGECVSVCVLPPHILGERSVKVKVNCISVLMEKPFCRRFFSINFTRAIVFLFYKLSDNVI